MCKISIIMPVYNKEKYVKHAIQSIQNQLFKDWELIVIDDGSTDNSLDIIKTFCIQDDRIKVYHIENGGVSNARNVGLKKAKGEYITFVDSDDYCHEEYLLNLYTLIVKYQVDMVISGFQTYFEDRSDTQQRVPPIRGFYSIDNILNNFVELQKNSGVFGFICSKILKKELCQNIYFDKDLKLAEDFDFFLKVYEKVKEIYFDEKCYYYYLQQSENSSAIINDENVDYYSQLIINLKYKKFLLEKNVYIGNNRIIVDQLISNYVFFVVLHSPLKLLNKKLKLLYNTIQIEKIKLYPNNIFQKVIFTQLGNNMLLSIYFTMFMRKVLRKNYRRS